MSKLQRYPSYKESGVEWLGEIPEGWEVFPLKSCTKIKSEKNYPDLDLLSVYLEYGIVKFEDIDKKRTNATSVDLSEYQLVDIGDFVLNNQQAWRGSVGVSIYRGIVSPAYIILKLSDQFNSKFANYYFRNGLIVSQYLINSKGVGTIQRNLYWASLKQTYISIPPKQEQTLIASYLDKKTTQIDKAISQKQKLIELLKERRQIVINDAVTKGLDKTVEFVDSGVEWIGEIPRGWEISKVKNVFKFNKGLTITKENLQEEGIFCVNYGEIHSKYGFEVNPHVHDLKCVNESYLQSNKNSLLNNGDFIFADTSEDIEGSGNFTYLNSSIPTFAGYHTIICRPKSDIVSRFFAYEFDSMAFRTQIQKRVKGVKVYSITQSLLKDMIVWIPPRHEQLQIVEHIETQTAKIDQAIELQQSYIAKLKEYKASLIDSVVTGKVRVV